MRATAFQPTQTKQMLWVSGVGAQAARGFNQLFKQLKANDVITNTDLQALSTPSGATGHISSESFSLFLLYGGWSPCSLCVYLLWWLVCAHVCWHTALLILVQCDVCQASGELFTHHACRFIFPSFQLRSRTSHLIKHENIMCT